jgi:hypothetical protein
MTEIWPRGQNTMTEIWPWGQNTMTEIWPWGQNGILITESKYHMVYWTRGRFFRGSKYHMTSQWLWKWELTSHLGQYIWELYWPESKLTKSDINWKKVMKSIMNDITCLFSWIKKNMSLSVWSSSSLFSLSSSLHSPSSALSLLSYTGTCKICQTQHTTRMSLCSIIGHTWLSWAMSGPFSRFLVIFYPLSPRTLFCCFFLMFSAHFHYCDLPGRAPSKY